MIEILWILPILASIALVLGSCRAADYRKIFRRATRSFLKMVVGLVALAVSIQLILFLVPLLY